MDAGWSDESFFPIGIFLGKDLATYANAYQDLGVNFYMAVEYNADMLSAVTGTGMHAIVNIDNPAEGEVHYTLAEIGSDPNVVGLMLCDEPDQGLAGYIGTDDENGWLAVVEDRYNAVSSDTSRFKFINFGTGITRGDFWSPNTIDEMQSYVDAFSFDKYTYTSTISQSAVEDFSPDWPTPSLSSQRSAAYGWLTDQGHGLASPRKPVWPLIETKVPYIDEAGMDVILYDEIRGAVYSSLCHGARAITYFTQNGFTWSTHWPATDPNTGSATCPNTYSLVDCESALATYVAALNAEVAALSPVLNTQSYDFDFGATGIDTMLKAKDGYAYIFASVALQGATGSKTFTLTGSGINGTSVQRLYGGTGNISVTGGQFTDTFANEYSHRVYKVAI